MSTMNTEDEGGSDLYNTLKEQDNVTSANGEIEERRKKNMTHGKWLHDRNVVEVLRLTGNYWKNHGFSRGNVNYFYPEEALYLVEKHRVYVDLDEITLSREELYKLVLQVIPHACYLTYLRIKTLEYICTRHSEQPLRCWSSEAEIYEHLLQHPSCTLLNSAAAFNIYAYDATLVKRKIPEATPTGYVIVTTMREVFSPPLLLTLLEEAQGVPVLFAIMLPTGNVVLEEFTDATISLQWKSESFQLKP